MSGKVHGRVQIKKRNMADHSIKQCNHQIGDKFIHQKTSNARESKKIVTLLDNKNIRDLIVPDPEPTKCTGIWSSTKFKKLKKQAHVLTNEDKIAIIENEQLKKQQLIIESKNRTDILKQAQKDEKTKAGSKLCAEDAEAAEKTLYALQRAFELRQEQEDEVKTANTVILAAKCLVIRQAQINEKELIRKEWTEEERRLDEIMEQERQKALRQEEERKRIRKERSQKQVQALSQQIFENEVLRLKELERKEEESRSINKALITMQRDDAEKIRLKNLENKKIRENLNRANKDMEQFRIVQKEEERIADLRTQEFMRKKAEREAKREAELAEIKAAKEREKARLEAEQLQAMCAASDEAELQALRVQEEVEREWREKERLAALKRKQDNDDLKRSRAKQLEDIKKQQALKIQKEEEEFHKVAQVQRELHERDCERKKKKREAAIKHRKELLQQINDKELDRIAKIKEKFEEGGILRMEQEMRSANIQNIIRKKVQRMRTNNVPEQVVADVERQLKI